MIGFAFGSAETWLVFKVGSGRQSSRVNEIDC